MIENEEKNELETNGKENESALLTWSAPDLIEHSRGWGYFTGFGLFFIAITAYFVYARDWFAVAIVVILPFLILFYQLKRKPEIRSYTITELGIYEDDLFYPYNEIYSFWLNINHIPNTLNIIFSKKYLPQLSIQIKDLELVKIRDVLTKYIPEESSKTESLVDKIARFLKI